MAKSFETEKSELIARIQRDNQLVELILNNTDLELANHQQIDQLHKIKAKNEKYIKKLKSNEFEVAIVGLEKAGKSTFANALICNDVLPSAPERCTFTTTKLVSGSDEAIIKFYTESEFEEIFRMMLKEIQYPNAENESFKTIDKEKFEDYFNKLEEENSHLYKAHVGKTNEEIIEIIHCRKKLRLDGGQVDFVGDELNSDNFKEYIKGNKGDVSKPRSVKSIEIRSSKLQQMSNIVMYDVPGFDSPTQLHMRQTEERLKAADAIILVTNVGTNPSIQGTSLNVIRNNTDEDGIDLKDKLFVFGNQIDRVNEEEQIKGNEAILRKDVLKHKIGRDNRVFVGSALQYLGKNGIVQDVTQSRYTNLDDGIDTIREALIHYYETDRFEILKKKVIGTENNLKEVFKEIKEVSNIGDVSNFNEDRFKSEITFQESKAIEKRLRADLKDYFSSLKQNVLEERWLSAKLQEELADEKYFQAVDADYFSKIQRINNESLRLDIPFGQVNRDMRKEIHLKYLEEYLEIIKNITDEKCRAVEQELQWKFACAVCGSSAPPEEILKHCQGLIHKITGDVAHQKDKFTYLIERFSRDIFDITLKFPIASNDRLERYKQAARDMHHLDYYYSDGKGRLINLILTQEEKDIVSTTVKEIMGLMQSVVNISSIASLSSIKDLKDRILVLKDYLNRSNSVRAVISDKFNVEELLSGEKAVKSSENQEEVIQEINADLNHLRKILINAVVPAIDLEVAFLNSLDKQIKLLLASMDNNNQYAKVFNKFASSIVTLVKKEELDNVTQKVEKQKLKRDIIEQIDVLV